MAFIPGQLTQLTAAHDLYLYSWVYLLTRLQFGSSATFKVQATWDPEISTLLITNASAVHPPPPMYKSRHELLT